MKSSKSFKGVVCALISSGTFGLIPLFSIPLMTENQMGLPSILFYRFIFSTLIMGGICLLKKDKLKISGKDVTTISLLGILYAITALCLVCSYEFIPSGISTTIHFLYPIFVSFLMVVFFKEKRSAVLLVSALLSLLGVALLCWTGGTGINIWGVMIAGITVVAYGIYIVGINKSSVRHMSAEVLTFYILLAGAVLFFIFAISTTGIQAIPSGQAFGRLLFLAFLPTVLSDLTLIIAIKYAGSTITSILGSMEPLVAVLVGVVYFSEYFGLNSFIGLLLILFSVTLVILFGKKNQVENLEPIREVQHLS